MLRITVIAVGKDKDRWVADGSAHFEKLLSRWCRLEWVVVAGPRGRTSRSPEEIRRDEAASLLNRCGDGYTVALSDSGKSVDSPAFARLVSQWQLLSGGEVKILIGGPFGLHTSVLQRANLVLSLSPLTFSHQLVRLVLLEQLYRGFSILHGTDYHK